MGDPHTHEFFRLLSLCHTVMSEEKNEGELRSWLSPVRAPGYCCFALLLGWTFPGKVSGWDGGHLSRMLLFLLPTRRAVL